MSLKKNESEILNNFLLTGLHKFLTAFTGGSTSRWRMEQNIREELRMSGSKEKIEILKNTIKELQKKEPSTLYKFLKNDDIFIQLVNEYLFSDKDYMLKLFLQEKK